MKSRTSLLIAYRGLLLVILALPGASLIAQESEIAGEGIFLPFAPNETWYVCQGYRATTSNTHNNSFALDLTRDPDGLGSSACYGDQDYSEGEPVFAPGPGVLSFYGVSVDDLVCLDLDAGGSLLIGHLDPDSLTGQGRVDSQEILGLLAGPSTGAGGVDNGDYSHIHIQAYSSDDCTGGSAAAEPFEGEYKFFGVPDLPDLRPYSAQGESYRNHYFGTGLSYLITNLDSEDAGMQPSGCSEAISYNEIYLGNCSGGSKIHSGLRFQHLPANQGEWVSASSLVVQTDGHYNNVINVDIRGEKNSFAQAFGPGSMPSDRLGNLTSAKTRWSISDPWDWRNTRETPNLRAILQEIVDRPDWTRGSSKFALVFSGASTGANTHRRFMATERDPINSDPSIYPARVFVTQFRTRNPGDAAKGNNRPSASAGPDRFYFRFGTMISLDGRQSFDPDGDGIQYSWTQILGPTVVLSNPTSALASFRAYGFGETYVFELRVTDNGTGQLISTDTMSVRSSTCDPTIC
ncbi:MAG: hypothetical protein K0U98_25945 [Deltaproteobacteria bacterium]|nr:hypothetical protein [Deltaproteobacteria bacterium]